ncbi:hypothetical protein QTO34_002980 [Cnephaeus nilssonii]|uniref:Uncharacterized protein n=1 Tax=Cnephaeus nilssonii TaxID=3371016 RepID=A0AA40HU94_CNENI|nr:hypothetical protein QTO34_002980 [Eptesicus nilssonii]
MGIAEVRSICMFLYYKDSILQAAASAACTAAAAALGPPHLHPRATAAPLRSALPSSAAPRPDGGWPVENCCWRKTGAGSHAIGHPEFRHQRLPPAAWVLPQRWPFRLAPRLAPHLSLVPPPHLLHHPAYRAINRGQAPRLAPSAPGSRAQLHPPPPPLVTVCGVIGGAIRPLLAPALIWRHPLTCSPILPWSRTCRGPSGPAAPPLPPAASATSPTSSMFHAAPWWSAHIIKPRKKAMESSSNSDSDSGTSSDTSSEGISSSDSDDLEEDEEEDQSIEETEDDDSDSEMEQFRGTDSDIPSSKDSEDSNEDEEEEDEEEDEEDEEDDESDDSQSESDSNSESDTEGSEEDDDDDKDQDESDKIARQAAQIKLLRKLQKQEQARVAKEAKKQQAIMAAEEKRKQKEQIKIMKQQDRGLAHGWARRPALMGAPYQGGGPRWGLGPAEAKKKKKEEAANAKLLEAEKRIKEKERLKQEKRDEKRLNKERKLEQRRIELEIAKELKKPNEDMCLADQKPAAPGQCWGSKGICEVSGSFRQVGSSLSLACRDHAETSSPTSPEGSWNAKGTLKSVARQLLIEHLPLVVSAHHTTGWSASWLVA